MNKKVCDALVKLDDEIFTGPERWVQGVLQNAQGAVCLQGGIQVACLGHVLTPKDYPISPDNPYYSVLTALEHPMRRRGFDGVVPFNDGRTTTFEDVKAVIADARKAACEGDKSD